MSSTNNVRGKLGKVAQSLADVSATNNHKLDAWWWHQNAISSLLECMLELTNLIDEIDSRQEAKTNE